MYLSRSQIINRDSVVWIERKREGRVGEETGSGSESVGKEGWVEWGDGEGRQQTGGEMEGRWRNGE